MWICNKLLLIVVKGSKKHACAYLYRVTTDSACLCLSTRRCTYGQRYRYICGGGLLGGVSTSQNSSSSNSTAVTQQSVIRDTAYEVAAVWSLDLVTLIGGGYKAEGTRRRYMDGSGTGATWRQKISSGRYPTTLSPIETCSRCFSLSCTRMILYVCMLYEYTSFFHPDPDTTRTTVCCVLNGTKGRFSWRKKR